MSNPICWICAVNLIYPAYDETKLLDDDGSKPCFECLMEDKALEEEVQDEFG